MRRQFFLITFLAAAVVQLASALLDCTLAHAISKCLLMPALTGYYLSATSVRSTAFLAALFFCWLGDVILIWPSMFIGGVAAFLAGHVLYIVAYRQHRGEDRSPELLPTQKIRFSLPIILAGTGLIVVLFPALGSLKLPLMLYGVTIVVMVMTALFRYGRTTQNSFWLVFGGAVLFMISDSILAINKLLLPVAFASFWIMMTYMAAQVMIVVGIVRHR
jgi:uncharacterized membrane protein YhhN